MRQLALLFLLLRSRSILTDICTETFEETLLRITSNCLFLLLVIKNVLK